MAASATQHNDQLYISIYEDRCPFIEIDNQTNILIYVAEADFADFSKSLKPKKSIHDENFHWYCTVPPYRRQHFAPPSFNERFPGKHNANIHLIFGCANSGEYKIVTFGHLCHTNCVTYVKLNFHFISFHRWWWHSMVYSGWNK